MQYFSVAETAKKWNISERSNKKEDQPVTLLDILQEQKSTKYAGAFTTEPTTPLVSMRNLVGLFCCVIIGSLY